MEEFLNDYAQEYDLKLNSTLVSSKFSKLSVFSTLNNLIELDMHPEFSHMLGYTEKELHDNFEPYFKEFAACSTFISNRIFNNQENIEWKIS